MHTNLAEDFSDESENSTTSTHETADGSSRTISILDDDCDVEILTTDEETHIEWHDKIPLKRFAHFPSSHINDVYTF